MSRTDNLDVPELVDDAVGGDASRQLGGTRVMTGTSDWLLLYSLLGILGGVVATQLL
jgi:hypothetical protein